jgi:hypothetical protein
MCVNGAGLVPRRECVDLPSYVGDGRVAQARNRQEFLRFDRRKHPPICIRSSMALLPSFANSRVVNSARHHSSNKSANFRHFLQCERPSEPTAELPLQAALVPSHRRRLIPLLNGQT